MPAVLGGAARSRSRSPLEDVGRVWLSQEDPEIGGRGTRVSMYGINYVDALPGWRGFMFIDLGDDGALIYYRRNALTPNNLEDSWAAFRACQSSPPEDEAAVVPLTRYAERDGLTYAVC